MNLKLWSGNKLIIKPSELEGFILSEYGIGCNVLIIDGNPTIKMNNHFALFTLIGKIKRKFDFTVHHKKNKNEFIIIINGM
jgi:hypothetical protein